ncbi:MAG: SUMF1/EgtB/PvdO family nonheme iron enzyme [Oculatellaceae cyanobacterium bins.114]|nr:SUMF1/EgtB/PvdO family nonheme iron enzyme [Oculatellaceae cyanobacterium bins.114]
MAKVALLIGVSKYEPGLNALPGASQDVAALKQALEDPQIGKFDRVQELLNPEPQDMQLAIEMVFSDRAKDDLVVLFFSGHGIKDDQGRLYFATPRTRTTPRGELVKSTAVSAVTIHEFMSGSRAKRQVVILDCCFSGAFATDMPAKSASVEDISADIRNQLGKEEVVKSAPVEDISADIRNQLGEEGRAVLTSSTATQYSLEQPDATLSVYTRYLVEGLTTGAADQDNDGAISVNELHEYARSKVHEAAPAMKPEIYTVREGYKIKLAKASLGDPKLVYRKEVEKNIRNRAITIVGRRILKRRQTELRLLPDVATAIEDEVLQPYREYEHNLREYEQACIEAVEHEGTLSSETREDLKRFQQMLKLRDEDVAPVEASVLGQTLQSEPIAPPAPQPDPATYFNFEVITVNAKGEEKNRDRKRAEYFVEDLGNGVTLEMVKIPAGEFLMGTADIERDTVIQEATRHGVSQEDAETWTDSQRPQHRVKVPEFWLGKFAATQAQWKQVAGLPKIKLDLNSDPANFKGAKRPVEQVSWDEAVEFCARLSRKTNKPYRLPTEAEWEYACRAGTTTPFHFGETITFDLVNYDGNYTYGNAPKGQYRKQTTDVGNFPANAFGLYDMHGNVWEWCADQWYGSYANKPDLLKQNGAIAWTEETTKMAPKSDETNYRLLRGGSWVNYPRFCRSANRLRSARDNRYLNFGFRVVCSIPRTF